MDDGNNSLDELGAAASNNTHVFSAIRDCNTTPPSSSNDTNTNASLDSVHGDGSKAQFTHKPHNETTPFKHHTTNTNINTTQTTSSLAGNVSIPSSGDATAVHLHHRTQNPLLSISDNATSNLIVRPSSANPSEPGPASEAQPGTVHATFGSAVAAGTASSGSKANLVVAANIANTFINLSSLTAMGQGGTVGQQQPQHLPAHQQIVTQRQSFPTAANPSDQQPAPGAVNVVVNQTMPPTHVMKTLAIGNSRTNIFVPNVIASPATIASSNFTVHHHHHQFGLRNGPAPNVTVNPNGNFNVNSGAILRPGYAHIRPAFLPQTFNIVTSSATGSVQSPILAASLQTINKIAAQQQQHGAGAAPQQVIAQSRTTNINKLINVCQDGSQQQILISTGGQVQVATHSQSPGRPTVCSPQRPRTPGTNPPVTVMNLNDQQIRVLTPGEIMRTLPSLDGNSAGYEIIATASKSVTTAQPSHYTVLSSSTAPIVSESGRNSAESTNPGSTSVSLSFDHTDSHSTIDTNAKDAIGTSSASINNRDHASSSGTAASLSDRANNTNVINPTNVTTTTNTITTTTTNTSCMLTANSTVTAIVSTSSITTTTTTTTTITSTTTTSNASIHSAPTTTTTTTTTAPEMDQDKINAQQKSMREAEQERQWKQLQQQRAREQQSQQHLLLPEQRLQGDPTMQLQVTTDIGSTGVGPMASPSPNSRGPFVSPVSKNRMTVAAGPMGMNAPSSPVSGNFQHPMGMPARGLPVQMQQQRQIQGQVGGPTVRMPLSPFSPQSQQPQSPHDMLPESPASQHSGMDPFVRPPSEGMPDTYAVHHSPQTPRSMGHQSPVAATNRSPAYSGPQMGTNAAGTPTGMRINTMDSVYAGGAPGTPRPQFSTGTARPTVYARPSELFNLMQNSTFASPRSEGFAQSPQEGNRQLRDLLQRQQLPALNNPQIVRTAGSNPMVVTQQGMMQQQQQSGQMMRQRMQLVGQPGTNGPDGTQFVAPNGQLMHSQQQQQMISQQQSQVLTSSQTDQQNIALLAQRLAGEGEAHVPSQNIARGPQTAPQQQGQQNQQQTPSAGGPQSDGASEIPDSVSAELEKLEQEDNTGMGEVEGVGDLLGELDDDDAELLDSLTAEMGEDFNILEYADPELDTTDGEKSNLLDSLELDEDAKEAEAKARHHKQGEQGVDSTFEKMEEQNKQAGPAGRNIAAGGIVQQELSNTGVVGQGTMQNSNFATVQNQMMQQQQQFGQQQMLTSVAGPQQKLAAATQMKTVRPNVIGGQPSMQQMQQQQQLQQGVVVGQNTIVTGPRMMTADGTVGVSGTLKTGFMNQQRMQQFKQAGGMVQNIIPTGAPQPRMMHQMQGNRMIQTPTNLPMQTQQQLNAGIGNQPQMAMQQQTMQVQGVQQQQQQQPNVPPAVGQPPPPPYQEPPPPYPGNQSGPNVPIGGNTMQQQPYAKYYTHYCVPNTSSRRSLLLKEQRLLLEDMVEQEKREQANQLQHAGELSSNQGMMNDQVQLLLEI
uniref:Histone-lysine N-methyltransferase n=1 Tax=Anopheles culicifacies TaxID=139723 RepID=A0A182MF99_9DIPT